MDDVQIALADLLGANTYLQTTLKNGENSVLAERDADPDSTPYPFVVLEFISERENTVTREMIQTWVVRAYNKNAGYNLLDQIVRLGIKPATFNQTLSLASDSDIYCLNQGVRYGGTTRRGFDRLFRAETIGVMVDIHLMPKSL